MIARCGIECRVREGQCTREGQDIKPIAEGERESVNFAVPKNCLFVSKLHVVVQALQVANQHIVSSRTSCSPPPPHRQSPAAAASAATPLAQPCTHFCSTPRASSLSREATAACSCSYSLAGRYMLTALKSVWGWLHLQQVGGAGEQVVRGGRKR